MHRIAHVFFLALLLIVAPETSAGTSKKFDPQPVPSELIAIEDALAGPGLIGLVYLDMEYALRLEKEFMGEGDALALPTSSSKEDKDDDSFFNFLRRSGVNPGESVDYILGGFLDGFKDGGQVQVALGKFPVESIEREWQKNKNVQQTEVNGRKAWLWSRVDKETCKPSPPELMVVENQRLIVGDPEAVAWFLQRLDQPKAETDLSKWRRYRTGKLFAFAVLVPKNLDKVSQNGLARMYAHSAKEQIAPVTGIFGGGTISWKPRGIDLELLFETANAKWNEEQRGKFLKWKKEATQKIDPEFKTVKNLMNYLDLKATDQQLVMQAKVNEALIKDIGKVFQEGLDWFASSLSSSFSISGEEHPSDEKTIPYKEVNQYKNSIRPRDLDPFDSMADPNEQFSTTTGPFGIQITGISLNPKEAGVVDLDLKVISSSIPKLEINSFADEGEGTGSWFRVNRVVSKNGKELLKEELCGKDRNSKAIALQKGYRNIEVKRAKKTATIKKLIKAKPRWSNLTLEVLQRTKTIHLKPGTRLSDIASIEGEVILQLPADISKKRIGAPFNNKVVQTSDLRIKMKQAASDSVSFSVSGNTNNLLETRALNSSGKYLQSGSSMSSGLFFGKGVNKNKQFRGQPKTVEFVLARKTIRKTYPFKLKYHRPTYPAGSFFKPVAVETQSKRALLNQRGSTPRREVCSNSSIEFRSRPFYICMDDQMRMQSKWKKPGKYASGSFLVHSQDTAAITNNLSAAQLIVEKVIVKDGNNPAKKTLLVKDDPYLSLSSNYVSPLKGDQVRIEAGPVKKEDEQLTPVGFEGYLIIRLPRKLDSFRLDLFSLGSTAQSPNGLKAKFTGISEKGIRMEIEGPRETLIHFTPLNLRGKPLKQKDPKIKKIDIDGKVIWQAEVQVPPGTHYMDIVFASKQETWKIPFHLEK